MSQITVSVRTDFTRRSGDDIEFDLARSRGRVVEGARVVIVGTNADAVTNQRGQAVLDLGAAGIGNGSFVFRISHSVIAQSTRELGGPRVADPLAEPPDRIYRQLDVHVQLEAGQMIDASVPTGTVHGAIGHRDTPNMTPTILPIDWK